MDKPFKRERKANFSSGETSLLLQRVEENTSVVNSGHTNSNTVIQLKRKVWNSIAKEISDLGGTHRELNEVKKKWTDMRTAVKIYLRDKRRNPLHPTKKRPPYIDRILGIIKATPKSSLDVDELVKVKQQLEQDNGECQDIIQENEGSFQIVQVQSLATGDTKNIILDATCRIPENSAVITADTSHILEGIHQVTEDTHHMLGSSPRVTADTSHTQENSHEVTEDTHDILENSPEVTSDTSDILENSPQVNADTSHIPENSHQVTADAHHILENGDPLAANTHLMHEENHEFTANITRKNHQMTSDRCQISERKRNLNTGGIRGSRPRRPIRANATGLPPQQNGHVPGGMACTSDLPQVFDASNASTVILKMRERSRENTRDEMWDRWLESEMSVNEKRKECMDAYLEVMELKKRKLELDIELIRNAQSNR